MHLDPLIDYLFICGLDVEVGLDSYYINNDVDDTETLYCLHPLKRSYKSSILQRFPDKRESFDFPDDLAVTSLCMPNGLSLSTLSTAVLEPVNHNFIIIREDGSRIYGTALLFLERIEVEAIKKAVRDLQNEFRLSHTNAIGCVLPCANCHRGISDCVHSNERNSASSNGSTPSLQGFLNEFWIEDEELYTFKAIGVLSQHAYIQCHQSWLYDIWLNMTKSPSASQLLSVDLGSITKNVDIIQMTNPESFIYNMLFEVNSPERGKTLAIDGPSTRHYCRCPDADELPIFEMPIRGLLEILGLENFIKVYSCVMLEYRVVILSQDYRLLMLVAECITTLLFPFVWSHVYAPILPLAARHFLNAPVPFIMGIKLNDNETEETVQLASDASVCYVNVDRQTVTSSDDIPTFPYELDLRREITEILVHSIKYSSNNTRLQSSQYSTAYSPSFTTSGHCSNSKILSNDCGDISITNTINPRINRSFSDTSCRLAQEAGVSIHYLMQQILDTDDDDGNSKILPTKYCDILKSNKVFRELFFNHFLHIFCDYEQFIIPPKANVTASNYFVECESSVEAFDKAGFLSEQPETHLPFLSAFLETQMFAQFIDMKILSAWQPAHPNLVLFERNLRKMQHTVKSQLSNSHHAEINFKPYFKSDKLIKDIDAEFRGHLVIMMGLLPNDPATKPPQNGTKICINTRDVPQVNRNGDGNTDEPRCIDITQDLEFNKTLSTFEEEWHKKKMISNKTQTLGSYCTAKVDRNMLSRADLKPYIHNIVPGVMIQSHSTFVKTLLQESKAKTKRMVLEKMGGQEAVDLGHDDRFVSGIEENTLVACLCDLLERMWSHGLIGSHGKSALWSHLTKFVERDMKTSVIKQTNKEKAKKRSVSDKTQCNKELVKDSLVSLGINSYCLFRYFNGEYHNNESLPASRHMKEDGKRHGKSRISTPDFLCKVLATSKTESDSVFTWDSKIPDQTIVLNPFGGLTGGSSKTVDLSDIFGSKPHSLAADVLAIKAMTDIRTEVGLARAFVRLALEKKLLSEHLETLLSDSVLLRTLYNRYAFLRCEEECKQFIFNMLALAAVDYYSFTNLYINSQLIYRMYIHTGQKFSTGKNTSANAWFCVNGHHCSSGVIKIPKDDYQFDFKNQNMGILTTMKIGHDNSGLSPKWYIEFILIQNRITDQIYRFPCGHWFSKSADDGSTERLLIGELIGMDEEEIIVKERGKSPSSPKSHSFSGQVNNIKVAYDVTGIQEQLGNAVNNLVKYCCRQQDREKLSVNSISGSCNVSLLLCGEGGIVSSMEQVFLYGFRSSGFFQKKMFLWDYLEKVTAELEHDLECQGHCIGDSSHRNHRCSAEISSINVDSRISNIQYVCKLINKISRANSSIGKDGKFQRFVCVCVRDHKFRELIGLLALLDCTVTFYDESCFFRNPDLCEVLIAVMSSLDGFIISLEPALIDGI